MAYGKSKTVWLSLGIALLSTKAHSCTAIEISNVDMVKAADVIVRARAADYLRPPGDPTLITTGVPDSRVHFTVIETVKGQAIQELVLPGYLVATDDFNDKPAPYTFVRPGGRRGSCFANSYRRAAQYLLFLKRQKDGEYTVNWAERTTSFRRGPVAYLGPGASEQVEERFPKVKPTFAGTNQDWHRIF